jgi:hypothetical protein
MPSLDQIKAGQKVDESIASGRALGSDAMDTMLKESQEKQLYWKREAESAKRNLRVLQHVSKELLAGETKGGESVMQKIMALFDVEWKEKERELVESYERKLRDLEEKYRKDVALVVEERGRLDSALNCIRGLCDIGDEDQVLVESPGASTVVHNVQCAVDQSITSGFEVDMGSEEGQANDGSEESMSPSDDVIYTREESDQKQDVRSSYGVVGYKGEIPDVLTENAMNRILDDPRPYSISHQTKGALIADKSTKYWRTSYEVPSPTWKIPSATTRTQLIQEIEGLETRLKHRQDRRGQVSNLGPVRDSAEDTNPVEEEDDDEFVRTIKALGDSSPTTANLLAQHVSDSWAVQKYATTRPSSSDTDSGKSFDKKKSSFLQRQPIAIAQVFETSTPAWGTRY